MKTKNAFLTHTPFFVTLLCASFLVFSCAKKNVEPDASVSVIEPASTKDKRMVFATVADYEQLVAMEPSKRAAKLRSNPSPMASSVFRTSVDTTYYDSSFLQQLLNHDAVVQIGEWIIKVDMKAERVFALKTSYEKEYQDLLKGNTQNPHVLSFSTDEEVLELLKSHQASTTNKISLFKNCRSAAAKKDDGFEYINADQTLRIDAKIVYQKAGIYFSLQGKVKVEEKLVGDIWIDKDWVEMTMYYGYNYSIRCGNYRQGSWYVKESGNNVNYRPFESTTALEHYSYSIHADVPLENGTNHRTLQYTITD